MLEPAEKTSNARPTVRAHPWRSAGLVVLVALLAGAVATGVEAQGWTWPWESSRPPPPVPREPVYRPPGQPQPAPGIAPPPVGQFSPGGRSAICLQLEQRLAQEANRGSQTRDVLPKLEQEIRQTDRALQQANVQLERNECFEYFLFSKTLRRSRVCIDLNGQMEAAKRRLAELDAQRQQIIGTSGRSYQDEIIRELARNNCGSSYQQHASRSGGSSIWQDEESGGFGGGSFGSLPFATYRTVCVRLCDGYFFPISFATLPNHFDRDADACQSKCAAPVELFYHQNPGAAMEQAVSYKTKQAYTQLRSAFRYRREFVQGCSCKQAEYVPQAGQTDRRAEGNPTAPQAAAAPPRR